MAQVRKCKCIEFCFKLWRTAMEAHDILRLTLEEETMSRTKQIV